MELKSVVESKERLLNPKEILSVGEPNPGRGLRPTVRPRMQETPTTCKTLLPGDEGTTVSSLIITTV